MAAPRAVPRSRKCSWAELMRGVFERSTQCARHRRYGMPVPRHVLHPLHGRVFPLLEGRRNRHGDRVWFEPGDGCARSLPREWTSLGGADLFDQVSAGRAWG